MHARNLAWVAGVVLEAGLAQPAANAASSAAEPIAATVLTVPLTVPPSRAAATAAEITPGSPPRDDEESITVTSVA
jgi:hypothetical protein